MSRTAAIVLFVIGLSAACSNSATGPSPSTLTLNCATTTLNVGQQTHCTAALAPPNGAPQDVTTAVQWSSSNAGVATVSAAGLVMAVGVGSADITARVQTYSATRTMVVNSAPPTAAMILRISATGPNGLVVALQDVSTVTVDVSDCTGTGLSYRLAYGDGVVDTNPMRFPTKGTWFTHAYHALGTWGVQLTVTDAQGRQASTSALVTVKNLTGTWGNVIKNPSNGLTESRLLTLTQGAVSNAYGSLTGTYTHPAGNTEPLTGTVEDTGTIRRLATTSGTISFSGNTLDGEGVNPDASALKLIVKGGSADGLTLTFARQ
jgi:hypothetical protein